MRRSAEFSADLFILRGFLVALWLSAVPPYGYETQITPSASKSSRPIICRIFDILSWIWIFCKGFSVSGPGN